MINTNKLAAEIMVLICVSDDRNKITPQTQIKIQDKIDEYLVNENGVLAPVIVPKGTLCEDWIHQERVKANDDKYCPICGDKLQA